jgi:hypothetical protein
VRVGVLVGVVDFDARARGGLVGLEVWLRQKAERGMGETHAPQVTVVAIVRAVVSPHLGVPSAIVGRIVVVVAVSPRGRARRGAPAIVGHVVGRGAGTVLSTFASRSLALVVYPRANLG